ncbi:proline-rich protein HaeIII subfamily 1-like [Monodon monoceros]|uniref:proline-rich protein HaeIII subfamily 1-like n=1 Tax=Monodon monoceros TaxID=40151 RepID=UPI0010F48597|nr:proline-rich protein HaeIII subfamily 1-like [Monodon monoceros]
MAAAGCGETRGSAGTRGSGPPGDLLTTQGPGHRSPGTRPRSAGSALRAGGYHIAQDTRPGWRARSRRRAPACRERATPRPPSPLHAQRPCPGAPRPTPTPPPSGPLTEQPGGGGGPRSPIHSIGPRYGVVPSLCPPPAAPQSPPTPGSPPRLSPRRDPAQPAYPTPRPPRIPKPEPQAFGHSGSPPPPPPRLPPSGKPRQEGHQALEDAWACLHHGSCPPSSCQSPRWSRRGARRGRPGLPQQVLPNPRRPSFSCPVRAGPEPQTFSKVPAGISRAVLVQGEGAPEAQPGCGPARRHPRCLDLGQVPGLWGV